MTTCIKRGLLALALLGLFVMDSQACRRSCGGGCYYEPVCWYPCAPCCPCEPPDFRPLIPPPQHPQPVPNGTRLFLQNKSYSDAFATIYLRHPDGIYRAYEKLRVPAGSNALPTKQKYYQGDDLLIYTWTYGYHPYFWYQCHCCHLVTLHGLRNWFDVIHCHHWSSTKEEQAGEEAARDASPATIVVSLPADAKLTFDGNPTSSTSANRVFTTPELEAGKEYSYTLKAEVVRDGQVRHLTRRVTVRAGEKTRVTLDESADVVTAR